jgi:hypothetical protein
MPFSRRDANMWSERYRYTDNDSSSVTMQLKNLSLCSTMTSNMCLALLIRSAFWESVSEWGTHRRENICNPISRLSISLIVCFDSSKYCISSPAVAKGKSLRNWLKFVPNTWRGRSALDWSIYVKSPSVKRLYPFLTWDRQYTVEPATLYNFLWIIWGSSPLTKMNVMIKRCSDFCICPTNECEHTIERHIRKSNTVNRVSNISKSG